MDFRKDKKITRNEVVELIVQVKIAILTQEELANFLECEVSDLSDIHIEPAINSMLNTMYGGVTNGFLSDVYYVLKGKRLNVIGGVEPYYPCNCCGYLTLSEKFGIGDGGWDICKYCFWEDTPTLYIAQHDGCNRGSIVEYRENIKKILTFIIEGCGLRKLHQLSPQLYPSYHL